MIGKLSKLLTIKLISNGKINKNDEELYIYGFFMLLSQAMFFVITCIFGLIIKILLESIIFYVGFQLIRKYAGGYHATTETLCEILTTLSLFFSILIIKLSKIYNFQYIMLLLALVSAFCIFCFCPLDTPEKPLDAKEFIYFRNISWIILLLILSITIVSYIFKFNILFSPCSVSLVLESILLIAGKIKRSHKANSVK